MSTLLIDFNNLAMRNFFTADINATSNNPEYQLLKFQIFNQIYWNVIKFKSKEVIIAVDNKNSWRKSYFPRYKESRKKKRNDDINWNDYFEHIETFLDNMQNSLPFKILRISRCEGDDIIGYLNTKINGNNIIISTDEDYKQCITKNKQVYNPFIKDFVSMKETKEQFLIKKCLMGQAKDDIFNCKTPNDYPFGMRKPGVGIKTVEKILESGLDKFLDTKQSIKKEDYTVEFLPRDLFKRNDILINFDKIPKILTDLIQKSYDNYTLAFDIVPFLKKEGWTGYLEKIDVTEKVLSKLLP